MSNRRLVFAAHIQHKYGADLYAAASLVELNKQLATFCSDFADDVEDASSEVSLLYSQHKHAECVEVYFEWQAEHGNESLTRFPPVEVTFEG